MKRSPTFLVGTAAARNSLADFQKKEEHVETSFGKRLGIPLCFHGETYQRTHPAKQRFGYKDADSVLVSPMMVGVCDGVSQLEEFGMDPSELPRELMRTCEDFAMNQLVPDEKGSDVYRGPVSLLCDAYEATDVLGSTTVLICALDNMSKIHGKVHPMIAVLSIGDCELLLLRRNQHRALEAIFHTEMQRIDGHAQTPLQVARVDERIDPDFDDEIALEVIREGSAVHCLSTYEGDIVVLGSDGVFDNLFIHEIVSILDATMPPDQGDKPFEPTSKTILRTVCEKIIIAAHGKSGNNGRDRTRLTPIGPGGKVDDTSVVVAEVVEWTKAHGTALRDVRGKKRLQKLLGCFVGSQRASDCMFPPKGMDDEDDDTNDSENDNDDVSEEESDSEEEEEPQARCTIL
eukprot:GEMP01026888.1.p1 GENE.GEMP01026888.1~~GEMP01026888.1.p1  ORF type:complete len:412 (+),score=102.06 GEMP01026888.1:29-1237(+)